MAEYEQDKYPVSKPLPEEIKEYIIVKHTGWTLEYIRSLKVRDHAVFTALSGVDERIDILHKTSPK